MASEPKIVTDREEDNKPKVKIERKEGEPTAAFKGASWAALLIGVSAYLIGLFNATMETERKRVLFCRINIWIIFSRVVTESS